MYRFPQDTRQNTIKNHEICKFLPQKTLNTTFLSQKRAPGINFVAVLNAPKNYKIKKQAFTKPWGGHRFMKLFHKIDFLKDGFPYMVMC